VPFLPHTEADRRSMLEVTGTDSIGDLFAHVPAEVRLARALELPPALGEAALARHLDGLAAGNARGAAVVPFVGAGAYDHYVPPVVAELAGRAEFYTAYTPYQPEASQGLLQAIYEYQTMIASLAGLDAANASLYDGATALAESAMLCVRHTRRTRVIADAGLHPVWREVLATYATAAGIEIATVPHAAGAPDVEALAAAIDDATACVVTALPNFFGAVADLEALAGAAHAKRALLAVAANPLALALVRPPGAMGADVAFGEGQPLGLPLAYGGPYLGFLAVRSSLVRRLPGRLAGATVDADGRRAFVLTLQAREQHIRREKATSNICSNQALCALAAGVYLSLAGPEGLREVASHALAKTEYAKRRLAEAGLALRFPDLATFNEFAVELGRDAEEIFARVLKKDGIAPGLPLGRFFPELETALLVAVTEKRTREEIDRLAAALARECRGAAKGARA